MSDKVKIKIALSKLAKEEPELFGEVLAEVMINHYPGLKTMLDDIRLVDNGLITWVGKIYNRKLVEITKTTYTERRTFYEQS